MTAPGAGDNDFSPALWNPDFLAALGALKMTMGSFVFHGSGEGEGFLLQIDPKPPAFLAEGIPKGEKFLIFRPALWMVAGKGAEHCQRQRRQFQRIPPDPAGQAQHQV